MFNEGENNIQSFPNKFEHLKVDKHVLLLILSTFVIHSTFLLIYRVECSLQSQPQSSFQSCSLLNGVQEIFISIFLFCAFDFQLINTLVH